MAEINEYYGVASTATSDYLAHYGVRGMKWGVRRAIKSGDSQKLSKQYAKAQKKLAKLEKRATKTGKYARRAALMGAGAAAAGSVAALGASRVAEGAGKGLAKVTTGFGNVSGSVGRKLVSSGNKHAQKVGNALIGVGSSARQAGNNLTVDAMTAGKNLATWGSSDSLSKAAGNKLRDIGMREVGKPVNNIKDKVFEAGTKVRDSKITNDTIARVGAGLVGAGLAAGAAHNAYRAATAKKKAEKFRAEMNKAFAGTQYGRKSSGGFSKPKKRRR